MVDYWTLGWCPQYDGESRLIVEKLEPGSSQRLACCLNHISKKGHCELVSQQVVRFPMTITERLTFQELKIELISTDSEGDKLLRSSLF